MKQVTFFIRPPRASESAGDQHLNVYYGKFVYETRRAGPASSGKILPQAYMNAPCCALSYANSACAYQTMGRLNWCSFREMTFKISLALTRTTMLRLSLYSVKNTAISSQQRLYSSRDAACWSKVRICDTNNRNYWSATKNMHLERRVASKK